MKTLTAPQARADHYRLIDETAESSEPVRVVQETLYLLSIPGIRESIREGLETPVEECAEELDW